MRKLLDSDYSGWQILNQSWKLRVWRYHTKRLAKQHVVTLKEHPKGILLFKDCCFASESPARWYELQKEALMQEALCSSSSSSCLLEWDGKVQIFHVMLQWMARWEWRETLCRPASCQSTGVLLCPCQAIPPLRFQRLFGALGWPISAELTCKTMQVSTRQALSKLWRLLLHITRQLPVLWRRWSSDEAKWPLAETIGSSRWVGSKDTFENEELKRRDATGKMADFAKSQALGWMHRLDASFEAWCYLQRLHTFNPTT